jgi:hypothetical protein
MKQDQMKDLNPYLNASNSVHGGYKSSTWGDDDRRTVLLIKCAVLGACFLIIYQVIVWIV